MPKDASQLRHMPLVPVTRAQILALAPQAAGNALAAFDDADAVLAAGGINTSAARLVQFMAQVLHETQGLAHLSESMDYSAARMTAVWPARFPTQASAAAFAHKPQALADKVYGGRMGNTGPHDGSLFIGRGLLQITGRGMYESVGAALGIPLAVQPEFADDPRWSLKIAAHIWTTKGCNAMADGGDAAAVAKAINGGLTDLGSRMAWLAKTRKTWPAPRKKPAA